MSTGWEVATDNAGPVTNGWITSNPTSPTSHAFTAPPSTYRPFPLPLAASPKPHIVSAQANKNAIPDSDWASWGTNPATIRSEDEQVVRPAAEYVQLPMKSNLSAGTTRPSQPRPGPATSAPHPGPIFNARPPVNGHRNNHHSNVMPPRNQPTQPRMHAERPAVTYITRPTYKPPPAATNKQASVSKPTVQTPDSSELPPLVRPDSPSEKSFNYHHAGSVKAASDADSGHAPSPKLPSAIASASDRSKLPSTVVSGQSKQASGWVVKVPYSPAAMPAAIPAVDGQNGYGSSPEMPSTVVSVKAEDAEVVVRFPRAPEPASQAEAAVEVPAPRTFSINLPDDIALRQLRDLKRYLSTLSSEQVQVHVQEPDDDSEEPYSIHWEVLEDNNSVRLECARVTEKLLTWVRDQCRQPNFGTGNPRIRQILSWALPSTSDHIVPSQVKVVQSEGQGPNKDKRNPQTPGAGGSKALDGCRASVPAATAVGHTWVLPCSGRRPNARYEMKIPLPPEQTSGLGGVKDWNFDQIAKWLSLKSFYQHRKKGLFIIEGDEIRTVLDGRLLLVTLLYLRNPHFSSPDPRLQWDESEQARSAQVILYKKRDDLKELDIKEATRRILQHLHPREVSGSGQGAAATPFQELLSILNTEPTKSMANQPVRSDPSVKGVGDGSPRDPDDMATDPARISTAAHALEGDQIGENMHSPAPMASISLEKEECRIRPLQILLYHPWVLPYKGNRHDGFYELRVQVSPEAAAGLGGYRNGNYVQIQHRLGLHSFFHHQRHSLFFIEGNRVQAILDGLQLLTALLHLRNPQFTTAEPKLWPDDSNKAVMLVRQVLGEEGNPWRNRPVNDVTGWLLDQLHERGGLTQETAPSALPMSNVTISTSLNDDHGPDNGPPPPIIDGQITRDLSISAEPDVDNPRSACHADSHDRHDHDVASKDPQVPFATKNNSASSQILHTSRSSAHPEEAVETDVVTWHVPMPARVRFLGEKWSHIHAIEAECGVRIHLVPSQVTNADDLRFIHLEPRDLSAPKSSSREALCRAIRLCKGLMIIAGTSSCLPFKADLPSWVPTEIRSLPPSDVGAALRLHARWNRKDAKMDLANALGELVEIYRSAAPSQTTPVNLPASSIAFGAAYELSTPLNSYTWTGTGSEDASHFRRLCNDIAEVCGVATILVDLTQVRHGSNQCGILILASIQAIPSPQQRAKLEHAYVVILASLIAAGADGLLPVAEKFETPGGMPKIRLTPAQVRVAGDFGHWRAGGFVSKAELHSFVAQLMACDKPAATTRDAPTSQQPLSEPCNASSNSSLKSMNAGKLSCILQGSPHTLQSSASSVDQRRELLADQTLSYTFITLQSYRRSLSSADWLAETHSAVDDGYICKAEEAAEDYDSNHAWSIMTPLQRMAAIGSATWAAWHTKSVWMACKASLAAPAHPPSSPAASLSGTVGPSASQIEGPGSATSSEYHSMKGDKAKEVTSWEEAEAQVVLEQSKAPRVSEWVQHVESQSPQQLSELGKTGTVSLTSEEFFGAHSLSQPHLSDPRDEADRPVIEVPLPTNHVVRGRIIGETQDTLRAISRRTGAYVRLATHVYGGRMHERPIWVSGPQQAVYTALQELRQLIVGQVPHFHFPGSLGVLMQQLSVQTKLAQLEQVKEQDETDPERWTPDLLFFVPPEALPKVTANIHRGKWNTGGATVKLEPCYVGQVHVAAPTMGHADSVCTMVVDCVRTIIPGWIPSECPAAKVMRDADKNSGFKMPQSAPTAEGHETEKYLDGYDAVPPNPHASGWRPIVKSPGRFPGHAGYGYHDMPEPIFTSRAGMAAVTHGDGETIY